MRVEFGTCRGGRGSEDFQFQITGGIEISFLSGSGDEIETSFLSYRQLVGARNRINADRIKRRFHLLATGAGQQEGGAKDELKVSHNGGTRFPRRKEVHRVDAALLASTDVGPPSGAWEIHSIFEKHKTRWNIEVKRVNEWNKPGGGSRISRGEDILPVQAK